jgi:tRNA(Glu) U13 pseudouridine synthase TruD
MKIQSFASYCFNQFLFLREKKIWLHKRLDGDIMQKIGDKDLVTWPVPGFDLPLPLEKTQAFVFEQNALQHIWLYPQDYERFGVFHLRWRRRPLLCYPQNFSFRFHQWDVIFSFFLPAWSYASVLFQEVDQLVSQFIQKKHM